MLFTRGLIIRFDDGGSDKSLISSTILLFPVRLAVPIVVVHFENESIRKWKRNGNMIPRRFSSADKKLNYRDDRMKMLCSRARVETELVSDMRAEISLCTS